MKSSKENVSWESEESLDFMKDGGIGSGPCETLATLQPAPFLVLGRPPRLTLGEAEWASPSIYSPCEKNRLGLTDRNFSLRTLKLESVAEKKKTRFSWLLWEGSQNFLTEMLTRSVPAPYQSSSSPTANYLISFP